MGEQIFFLDMDECVDTTLCANGVCSNTIGSYTCRCNPGYDLSNDGIACNGKDVKSN